MTEIKLKMINKLKLKLAYCLPFFRRFLNKDEAEKFYIAMIRSHFAFFGQDTSHWSNEDLKERLKEAGERISKCGLSTEEVIEVGEKFAKLIGKNSKDLIPK